MGGNGMPACIDAVYTWVDGQEPTTRKALEQTLQKLPPSEADIDTAVYRFRDSDELRYSLRSLQAHAPWINHVFVVSNGQIPRWMDSSQTGVTLVEHDEIFPDRDCLPTFNSTPSSCACTAFPACRIISFTSTMMSSLGEEQRLPTF